MSRDVALDLLFLAMTLGNVARVALAACYLLDRGKLRQARLDARATAGPISAAAERP